VKERGGHREEGTLASAGEARTCPAAAAAAATAALPLPGFLAARLRTSLQTRRTYEGGKGEGGAVQGGARRSKEVQGGARRCKGEQRGAKKGETRC
jgi:hypothetical protein